MIKKKSLHDHVGETDLQITCSKQRRSEVDIEIEEFDSPMECVNNKLSFQERPNWTF